MKGRAFVRGELVSEAEMLAQIVRDRVPNDSRMIHDSANVSPLAHVDASAHLGAGVVVEAFAFVGPNVYMGEGTWIGPNATLLGNTTVGRDCKFFPAVSWAPILKTSNTVENPQRLKSEIGRAFGNASPFTVPPPTAWSRAWGSDCLIMAYVHIAHDVQVGNHVILANACNVAGHVVIEDQVIIEGMVGIQQFVRIGKHAFIAGGSLVRKNVPPYIKAAREPLSYIGINGIGLRRRGFDIDRIQAIEDIYRTLYVLNNNMSQAVKAAELELPTSEDKDVGPLLHSQLGQRHHQRPVLMASPAIMAPQFEATGLTLNRGGKRIWADASWNIQGYTALLGANGAGKSSTLNMLAGQLSPDAGSVTLFRVHGADVTPEAWMRQVTLAAPWLTLPTHLTLASSRGFSLGIQKPS